MPIQVPSADVKIDGHEVSVKGPKGSIEKSFHPDMKLVAEASIVVQRPSDKGAQVASRVDRSLLANMIKGVTEGFRELRSRAPL